MSDKTILIITCAHCGGELMRIDIPESHPLPYVWPIPRTALLACRSCAAKAKAELDQKIVDETLAQWPTRSSSVN
jgi:hypothetical protein